LPTGCTEIRSVTVSPPSLYETGTTVELVVGTLISVIAPAA